MAQRIVRSVVEPMSPEASLQPAREPTRAHGLPTTSQTIAEVAARYGLTLRTLRFYEQKGLLAPVREGRRRLYDEGQLARIEAIIERRRLGFSVPEIASMLERHGAPLPRLTPAEVAAQIAYLEDRLARISAALAELRAMLPDGTLP